MTFASTDDLAVHEFDGHPTSRPQLLLRGRECGRSQIAVITPTEPSDWVIRNARTVRVNGRECTEADARTALAATRSDVVKIVLEGEASSQDFEFKFSIADERDLEGVDNGLRTLMKGRSLTFNAIDGFIRDTNCFPTARQYRDSIANYFYGVLAREKSPESGLSSGAGSTGYSRRFDEAVAELGRYDRGPAEAISGLVAFHYNHFHIALRKTRSPRIAQVSLRFAQLLNGEACAKSIACKGDVDSLDYLLSDNETEQIIQWSSIPLDGTASAEVAEIERSLAQVQRTDELKLRVVAAEHYLAVGEPSTAEEHLAELRNTRELEKWVSQYRIRAEGQQDE